MGESCYGRRLSELLQEQQEPFLLLRGGGAPVAGRRRRRAISKSFCAAVVRRALLAGCFSCGARHSFRRLRRACAGAAIAADDDEDDNDEECTRQLSPVSVLDLDTHSDEDSGEREEDDESPSISGKSSPPPPPPPDKDCLGGASPCFTFYEAGKICERETREEHKRTMKIISSWERIAGDIARIPMLVELDLTGSVQQWRRLREEEEVSQVGASIEAMIFEEMRVEAVRDMLNLPESLTPSECN